jgi:hypothetical protein
MAKDAGDKAPANNWVNDASARGFSRYEIELSDRSSRGRGLCLSLPLNHFERFAGAV